MVKNYSLAVFGVLAVGLLGLVWLWTGSLSLPSGESAIWFHAGLLTLLVAKFIVEYRYPKPNDVFVNCMVVFAATSTLSDPPYGIWWNILRWGALICGVTAVVLAWDPGRTARLSENRWRALLYGLTIGLGRSEVIFSFVFILSLISYFDLQNATSVVYVVFWGVLLLSSQIKLPELLSRGFSMRKGPAVQLVGSAHSFLAPSIVFCRSLGTNKPPLHAVVGFTNSLSSLCHCLGVVIGERTSASETRIAVALLGNTVSDAGLTEQSLLVTLSEDQRAACDPSVDEDQVEAFKKAVGTVASGTNISRVKFELLGNPKIAAGNLLSISTGDNPVFYQVFDGVVEEEAGFKDSGRAFVEGEAEQVGYWDNERGGFETHDWVARERALVYLADRDEPAPAYALKNDEFQIGTIPDANYPVILNISDLVLYHTAVLGVTGSGKSFLAYNIIETSALKGIKVICADPTGDYQRHLPDAVILNGRGSLDAFLESPDHMIGIIETASAEMDPILQTYSAANKCLDWCKARRSDEDVSNPRPKILLVLEEAHLLVPEWNFNPQRGMQDQVNKISQIVLQARKYGLGFLVVSQRTANVTKSVLNQCNTIVSFQAFDETGFDFLKNYMGAFHVRSLPNLKPRHGIVVGKASRSRRPVMVRLSDQVRPVRAAPAPNMPLPEEPAEVFTVPEAAEVLEALATAPPLGGE